MDSPLTEPPIATSLSSRRFRKLTCRLARALCPRLDTAGALAASERFCSALFSRKAHREPASLGQLDLGSLFV